MKTRERIERKTEAPAPAAVAAPTADTDRSHDALTVPAASAPTAASAHSVDQFAIASQPAATLPAAPASEPVALSPTQPPIPGGFIPESIVNDLIRAIDQSAATPDRDHGMRPIRKI